MSLFQHLLQPFTGIGKAWPLAVSLCASSWKYLRAFFRWQPIKAAAPPKDAPEGAAAEKV